MRTLYHFKLIFRYGEAAERLQHCFSPGVFDLVDEKIEDGNGTQKVAVLNNARYENLTLLQS